MKDADARLREVGFDGERLLGLVRDVANYHCQRIPYAPPGLADELASFLLEQALRATLRYDPALSGRSG